MDPPLSNQGCFLAIRFLAGMASSIIATFNTVARRDESRLTIGTHSFRANTLPGRVEEPAKVLSLAHWQGSGNRGSKALQEGLIAPVFNGKR